MCPCAKLRFWHSGVNVRQSSTCFWRIRILLLESEWVRNDSFLCFSYSRGRKGILRIDLLSDSLAWEPGVPCRYLGPKIRGAVIWDLCVHSLRNVTSFVLWRRLRRQTSEVKECKFHETRMAAQTCTRTFVLKKTVTKLVDENILNRNEILGLTSRSEYPRIQVRYKDLEDTVSTRSTVHGLAARNQFLP